MDVFFFYVYANDWRRDAIVVMEVRRRIYVAGFILLFVIAAVIAFFMIKSEKKTDYKGIFVMDCKEVTM